tara:strand:- start:203 stop:496 length:294 start_codon:yes stop_codon:yes gene_type:complete
MNALEQILSDTLNKIADADEQKMMAAPKNNFKFKEGKTVQVYHDWLSEERPDEKVKLIQKMWSEKNRDVYGMTTEKWIVEYSDGHELFRFFKTQGVS